MNKEFIDHIGEYIRRDICGVVNIFDDKALLYSAEIVYNMKKTGENNETIQYQRI